MIRARPFENHCCENVKEHVKNIIDRDVKFYLVQTSGPTSYVVKGALDTKFKVFLGNPHGCSCKRGNLCVHILFVLLKVLRVSEDDPLVWQSCLIERELDQILRGKVQLRVTKRQYLKKRPCVLAEKSTCKVVEKKEFSGDDVCPICQDSLQCGNERTSHCRSGCGNSMHSKCMKIWADHQVQIGNTVTCPLCRCDWGVKALEELSRGKHSLHFKVQCHECRKTPIAGRRYRCLVCPVAKCIDLCEDCYLNKNSHFSKTSHPFIVKESNRSLWHSAKPCKSSCNLYLTALQERDLRVEDYDSLLTLDDPFTASAKVQEDSLEKLILKNLPRSKVLTQVECKECPMAHSEGVYTYCCKTFLHVDCAKSLIETSYVCKFCSLTWFPGISITKSTCTSNTAISKKRNQTQPADKGDPNIFDFVLKGRELM